MREKHPNILHGVIPSATPRNAEKSGVFGEHCLNSAASHVLCDLLGRVAQPPDLSSSTGEPQGRGSGVSFSFPYYFWTSKRNRVAYRRNNASATCWVRVAQRSAAAGMGWQFIPRIGQEVLVQFIEGDIDRPLVIAALYNGQGEGGVQPTTGGAPQRTATETHRQVFDHAHDHSPSAQGNLTGGNSPVWHGGAADKHHNAAAITGIRTKEFGGYGYNQLALDDSDEQGRIQLKTTQAATELNLGHLIHTADNYRGSFRGQGAELRTDAYGALRAGAGYLITSYPARYTPQQRDAAADNIAGNAHLKQAVQLISTFNQAAKHHQTVQYSTHIGSHQNKASSIASASYAESPIQALHTAARGMVSDAHLQHAESDAQNKHTRPEANTLPHSTDPILSLVGKAGLSMVAGQHLQLANQETSTLMSGQDSQFMTGEQSRMHTGQAIGMLAGAVGAGKNNIGLQFITAQDNTHIQAQSDEIKVQAKNTINVLSSHSHIDWAAAKSISITTAAGASITIEGGGILVQCPGKITVHAAKKVFTGAGRVNYRLPVMPRALILPPQPIKFDWLLTDIAGPLGLPLSHTQWRIVKAHSLEQAYLAKTALMQGVTDTTGKVTLTPPEEKTLQEAYFTSPSQWWLLFAGQGRQVNINQTKPEWTEDYQHHHALSAWGYADNLQLLNDELLPDHTERQAGKELKIKNRKKTINSLKG